MSTRPGRLTRPLLARLVAVALVLLAGDGALAQDRAVAAVRTGITPERTRIVFDMTRDTPYRFFRASDPLRVVLDLQDATFETEVRSDQLAGSPVLRLRPEMRGDGVLRVVIDLKEGAYRVRSFALQPDASAGRTHRIVVDVLTDRETDAMSSPVAAPVVAMPEPTPEVGGGQAPAPASDGPERATQPKEQPEAIQETRSSVGDAAQNAAALPAVPRDRDGAARVDFSGTWEHEWAWATAQSASQKFESFLQPRWDVRFANGVDVTAILRLRYDASGNLGPDDRRPSNYSDLSAPWYNNANAELSLRELYVDFGWGDTDWRIGKQQVVWGQADGLKVLDVVNPQSFREFILDDFDNSRIPLWTVNVNMPIGDTTNLQLLWIPDTTYHELAEPGTPFAFTSPRLIPAVPITAIAEPDKPDDPFADSDAGLALTGFLGGWDFSLNYLYRYLDIPVLPVRQLGPTSFRLEPEYRRSHLLGASFSNAFDDVTLRGEFAYNTDTFQATASLANAAVAATPEFSAVLGADWVLGMDALLSLQWFASHLTDYTREIGRDETEQTATLLYQQDFRNAAWRFRGIGIHSLNDGDTQWQIKLSYWYTSALELWLGGDVFSGNSRGLFGQFDDNDRVLMGFRLGF